MPFKIENINNLSIEDTLKLLNTSKDGLSSKEAKKRLKEYGYNEIPEYKEPLWHRIFRRFWGPIPWMIEIAALLSALVGRWEDFIIIMIMLFVNAFLDFYQEHKALNALEVLKKKLARKSIVLRDGEFKEIEAKELVPGDIIKIKIGDIIPADVKLIEGDFISVDQSALTGESLPVTKKKGDIAYSNSIVKQGEMIALVVATGLNTYFGKTVKLVAKAEQNQRSHFQQMVIRVGDFLIIITIVMVAIIIFYGIKRDENLPELLEFSLVLTVAAIPVALPTVLTVVMAIGALNLAKKQAIVSRLAAIEEMAGMDILCSDKTGTLTQNKMTVGKPFVIKNHSHDELFKYAVFASKKENNDPIEKPIFEYVEKNNINIPSFKLIKFIPFDPVRKRTEAIIQIDNKQIIATKGAPQVIIELSNLTDEEKKLAYKKVEEFAENGFRTLGVAYKFDVNEKFEFVGLIPLYDPPREDSKEAIKEAKEKGVEVKMVTGDNVAVARYIAKILGIGDKIYSIRELKNETHDEYIILAEVISKALLKQFNLSEEEIKQKVNAIVNEVKKEVGEKLIKGSVKRHESEIIKIIEEANGFAEVFPEDKYFIVDELQKADHIVGMTGDGVNDAPALRKADTGIAVSGATDAARAAADIILLAPGLRVIIDAIKEARITFERMKSYTIYRIAETIRVILFMTLAIVIFNFYPITALMIILLALLNDIPILAIAYDNTKIEEKPVRWDMHEMLVLSSWLGVAGVLSSFTIFYIIMVYIHAHPDNPFFPALPNWVDIKNYSSFLAFVQSAFFTKLVMAGHWTIFNTRTADWFFKKPYPSKILLFASISTAFIGLIIGVYGFRLITPIGWKWGLFLLGYTIVWFIFNDFVKRLVVNYYRKVKGVNVI
ncbi:plasma-membrane proton-efflux P-type ATPase [Caminibacter mediatlanticus]|uniref:Cation-transport ATPase, E1-E2 family protein n=1 Tax=Caminibacter mediatlanticus TB-2 TaxID=391592 RepID=A0AAI9F1M3_9BACT|nr:plasma-membrane proton-efflux P-type ATPase [Caminibacter mediatlanticus]EDM23852.1 cation-transport ATPase, E1-E2 family protein [Caminibacter mediatlanticus TB-2]